MSGIFVSYRRSDSQGEAGRLFDDLVPLFGEHTVFMDVSAIEAGRDFRKAIEEGVTTCGVLLVMMGPEWLNAKDDSGARRLDNPADFVRIETAAALRRDIPVIPVLVRGAKMPSAEQLPDDLKDLSYRNCVELTHARWRSDIQLLVEALNRLLGDTSQAGTIAGSEEAHALTQPGAPRQEAAEPSKLEDGGSAPIDAAVLQCVSRELALHIGPVAEIVVRRAASRCTSIEALYGKVAEEIDSPKEREKFLLNRASIALTPLPHAAGTTPPAKSASGTLEFPAPSEGSALLKPTRPATGLRLSSRRQYLLPAIGAGILLVLTLVLLMRFAGSRGADSSQAVRTPPQEAHIAESAPVQASTPPPPAETPAKSQKPIRPAVTLAPDEREPKPPEPVRVSPQASDLILIRQVSPVYPPLARQAHIQGSVVLDADISKDGAIETLKAISGHPLLIPAAVDAVKQWRYKPYVLKGEPVAVNIQIIVEFNLSSR